MLLKLIEQATFFRPDLDVQKLTNSILSEYLQDICELLDEQKDKLSSLTPSQLSNFCYTHLKSFFTDKGQTDQVDYFLPINQSMSSDN